MARAAGLGLGPVGIAPIEGGQRKDYFYKWLSEGQHGEMAWMARDPSRRANPVEVLPEALCILAFGLNYYQEEPARRGRIAKYALGKDYHKVMLNKGLHRISRRLSESGMRNSSRVTSPGHVRRPRLGSCAEARSQGELRISRRHRSEQQPHKPLSRSRLWDRRWETHSA